MIYKYEIEKLLHITGLTKIDISESCGWSKAYLTATLKKSTDPLSIKISSRIFFHFKKEISQVIPKERLNTIIEYIEKSDPQVLLEGKSAASKTMTKIKKGKATSLKGRKLNHKNVKKAA